MSHCYVSEQIVSLVVYKKRFNLFYTKQFYNRYSIINAFFYKAKYGTKCVKDYDDIAIHIYGHVYFAINMYGHCM